METGKLIEDSASANYPDLTYNVGHNGYTEDEISTVVRNEQIYPETVWSNTNYWDRPPYGVGYPSVQQPNTVVKYENIPIRPKEYEIKFDWHRIGILALIKFALFKLKTIGFLKFLFLLAFKFKLFITGVFLKFFLIFKLMTIYKSLILPLFFLQLTPTLMQLFSIPGQIMNTMMNAQQSATTAIPRPSILDGPTSVFRPGAGAIDSIIRPGAGNTGTASPGGNSGTTGVFVPGGPGGNPGTFIPGLTGLPGQTRLGETITNSGKDITFNKIDDLNLIDRQPNESYGLFDPTIDIYQTILDSEKCVERIACRIAVTEKGGVMPSWVNWYVICSILQTINTLFILYYY